MVVKLSIRFEPLDLLSSVNRWRIRGIPALWKMFDIEFDIKFLNLKGNKAPSLFLWPWRCDLRPICSTLITFKWQCRAPALIKDRERGEREELEESKQLCFEQLREAWQERTGLSLGDGHFEVYEDELPNLLSSAYVAFASTPLCLIIPSELLTIVLDSPADATPLLTL